MKKILFFIVLLFLFGFHTEITKNVSNVYSIDTTLVKKEIRDSLLYGIDISHYQGVIDWDFVGTDTLISFVIMRSSFGYKKDLKFEYNLKSAHKRGFKVGVYHYYNPDLDPVIQARNFIESVRLDDLHIRPVLDIEKLNKQKDRVKLIKDLKVYLNLLELHYGVRPIIYSYLNFYYLYLEKDFGLEYDFWLAAYNPVCENDVFSIAHIWQCSCKHRLSGINHVVDFNHMYISSLESLLIKRDTTQNAVE